jgi:hypothetical protein
MGFAAQEQPYGPGRLERVGGGVTRPVRDKRGRVISAFGLYGWKDGANVRVVLLVFVPVDGAANQRYTAGDKQLRPEVYARYTVPVGGTRELEEMKALGLPSFLRVTVRPLRN